MTGIFGFGGSGLRVYSRVRGAGYTVDARCVEHRDGPLQPEAREGHFDHAGRRQRVALAQRYAHLNTKKILQL